ncbi:MAG: large-conductance mechanosensitive channel protein MscL [Fibrobacter sp.]|nr:large-conductance mechanosensitive channel protein MscL [Fibrobacter sp.]
MGIKGKASSLLDEFKAFAFKGNIVDMAVGVIIGGAFGKIVSSFVNDIVMPAIGVCIGGVDFKDLKYVLVQAQAADPAKNLAEIKEVTLNYGAFIQNIVDFLIIAIVVFLVMKKFMGFMQNMRKKQEEAAAEPPAPPAPPEPTAEEKLLTEIRDLLKK